MYFEQNYVLHYAQSNHYNLLLLQKQSLKAKEFASL